MADLRSYLVFRTRIKEMLSTQKKTPNMALFFASVQEVDRGTFKVDLTGHHVRSIDKLPLAAHLFHTLAKELPHVVEFQTIDEMCRDLLGAPEPLQ